MDSPMTQHGAPSWIQHSGSDPAAARKFYETVLGWTVADMPMQDGAAYPGIMIGENPVGGFMPQPVSDGQWLIYITVDDVDIRFQSALDNGAEAVSDPADFPGVGRMATIKDPHGASIAIITYEAPQG